MSETHSVLKMIRLKKLKTMKSNNLVMYIIVPKTLYDLIQILESSAKQVITQI
jgi:hypothetical protein